MNEEIYLITSILYMNFSKQKNLHFGCLVIYNLRINKTIGKNSFFCLEYFHCGYNGVFVTADISESPKEG